MRSRRSFARSPKLTKGAYCRFDPGAAHQLAELLKAVAVSPPVGSPPWLGGRMLVLLGC